MWPVGTALRVAWVDSGQGVGDYTERALDVEAERALGASCGLVGVGVAGGRFARALSASSTLTDTKFATTARSTQRV